MNISETQLGEQVTDVFDESPIIGADLRDLTRNIVDSKQHIINSYTTIQRNAIVAPVTGLLIFNSTLAKYQFWNGTAWDSVGAPTADNILRVPVKLSTVESQNTYTIPELIGNKIAFVSRGGNFIITANYDFDTDLTANNFSLHGTVLLGEEVLIGYYAAGDGVILRGLGSIPKTSAGGDLDEFNVYNAPDRSVGTKVIDFTSTGTYSYVFPSGTKAILKSISTILTEVDTITNQPGLQFGISGTDALFGSLEGVGAANGAANGLIFTPTKAVTNFQIKVTGGVATALKGRVIVSFTLIEDES